MGTLSSVAEKPTVAVVGLGLIGRPAAIRLAAAGFDVRGWNRSLLAAALPGVTVVETPAEAALADVVVLLLADSASTGEVLAQLEPALRPGTVVLDMGSSEPDDSRERAARLAARGVGWVDAPISGGPEGTEAGTLAIMAGGSPEDVARVRPVLDELGGNVTHVGGVGAGHTMKIVNQVIVALSVETVAEAMALAERAGFTIPQAQEAVRGGSADLPQVRAQGTRMAERRWEPGGRVRTMVKDLRMAKRLAADLGLELPQLDAAFARYAAVEEAGNGDVDVSYLVELGRDRSARLPRSELQAIVDRLREEIQTLRVTIRLDLPEGVFPVVAESLAPGARSIAGGNVPGLRQAATMRRVAETLDVLVQGDLLATDVPPPQALIEHYGARAQMLAPIVQHGVLAGILSVHHGPDTRVWTEAEVTAMRGAAAEAERLLP